MNRFRIRRPSAGMTVAFVALIAALSGTAIALPGKSTVDSGDIKNEQVKGADLADDAVTSAKVRSGSLLAKDFKAGQVPAGPRGATGPAGPRGATGSSAASVFTSRYPAGGSINPGPYYGPITGIGTGSLTNESQFQLLSPAVAIVARDLIGRYTPDSGASTPGSLRTFTLRVNGADSALTCTYSTPATSCSNTTAAVVIPAGSLLSVSHLQGGNSISGQGSAYFAWRATTP